MSGTTDTNWKSYGPSDDGKTITPAEWYPPAVPADWDDLFKGSDVENLTAEGLKIPAGSREDAIDCVRGTNYQFLFCSVFGRVTLKGALTRWTFQGGVLDGLVDVGQFDKYWYLHRPPTTNGMIDHVTTSSGKPIRVRLWDATSPNVINSNVKVTIIPKWIWLPYFIYRWFYIRIMDKIAGWLKTSRRRL